jgi:hypothetical protein
VVCIGLVWLGGGLDWSGTFGFHKMLGRSRVAGQMVVSRAVSSSIELVRVHLEERGNSIAGGIHKPLLFTHIFLLHL